MLRKFLIALAIGASLVAGVAGQEPADDPVVAAGKEGAALGRTLLQRAPMPQVEADGTIVLHGGERIPGTQLVPGGDRGDLEALKALEGATAEELNAAGREAMEAAERDPRATGGAYRGLLKQQREDSRALGDDTELWQQTLDVLEQARRGELGETFSECVTSTTYSDVDAGQQVQADSFTCEQLHDLGPSQRDRDVRVEREYFVGGEFASDAVLRSFTVDIGLDVPADAGTVDWGANTAGTVRGTEVVQEPTADNGWIAAFAVTYEDRPCDGLGPDEPCAGRPQTVSIQVSGSYEIFSEEIRCTPGNCLLETDGFCSARWACTDSAPRVINGVVVDESFAAQMAPLFPSQTGLCFAATATYDCDYATGTLCWETPSGARQCATNTDASVVEGTCDRVAAQPGNCRVVSRECTEGSIGHNGTCYVESLTYECLQPIDISGLSMEVTNTCSGAVRCMGDECLNTADTEIAKPKDVAQTQANLLLVQHILSDWTVPGHHVASVVQAKADPAGPVEHFAGRPLECRKALGGTVDCCTQTTEGALDLWFEMYPKQQRQANADVAEVLQAEKGEGSWKDLSQREFTNASLNRSFTSVLETIRGGVHGAGASALSKADGPGGAATMESLTPSFIARAREEVQDPGWACTQDEFDLAVQREVGMCEKIGQRCESGAFGACLDKRDVYCCFNSPVSKAIRVEMAEDHAWVDVFGTASAPDCGGVSQGTLDQFDFNRVSLSDVIARMERAEVLPTASRIDAMTSMEKITGQDSSIVRDGETRENVVERTAARVAEVDLKEAALQIEAEQRQALPDAVEDPNVVGEVSLVQGFKAVTAGTRAVVHGMREGRAGAVAVGWRTRDGTAIAGQDYTQASGVLRWGGGGSAHAVPQAIVVETMEQPRADNVAPREFYIDLFDPTGGAVIGNVATTAVRIDWLEARPPFEQPVREPSLAFSKTFLGAVLATNDSSEIKLRWRISVTNSSPYPVRAMTIYEVPDVPPSGFREIEFEAGTPCSFSSDYGYDNPFGRPYTTCNLSARQGVMPGETISMVVRTAGESGIELANHCGAYAEFDVEGVMHALYYAPLETPSCMATGRVTLADDTINACAIARTVAAALNDFPLAIADRALAGFPEQRPGSGDSLGGTYDLRVDHATVYSELVDIPDMIGVDTRMLLGFEREPGRFASVATVTLTPCSKDLRPSVGPEETLTRDACRYIGPPYGAAGESPPSLRIAFDQDAPAEYCVLDPGATYFLNYTFRDMREPVDPLNSSCEAADGRCSLIFEWADEQP